MGDCCSAVSSASISQARLLGGEVQDALFVPAFESGAQEGADPALDEVVAAIEAKGKGALERRFGEILRRSIDEILDGRRTMRFDFSRVSTPEKSYLGAKVEIIARSALDLGYGTNLDYLIAGHEVDAKFSATGDWMIAPKNVGEICLVMEASEESLRFSVGVVRASEDLLRPVPTRDKKRSLHAAGKKSIRWIIKGAPYPENQLMTFYRENPDTVNGIFATEGGGQNRVNELFKRKLDTFIDRITVQTVAAQEDSSKRVRDARIDLRGDGIMILGYRRRSREIASALGIRHARQGQWIAIKVHPAERDWDSHVFLIDGAAYRRAPNWEICPPAPLIPDEKD